MAASSTITATIRNSGGATTTPVFGRLTYKDAVLYISDNIVDIGRNSTTSTVHFHVGKNSFVSRKHLQLLHDQGSGTGEFYLVCLSKNGVFVDDTFLRMASQPVRLPKTCTFRFPSTVIRITFESLYVTSGGDSAEVAEPPAQHNFLAPATADQIQPLEQQQPEQDDTQPLALNLPLHHKMDASNSAHVIYAPLNISIPIDAAAASAATAAAAAAGHFKPLPLRNLQQQQQYQQQQQSPLQSLQHHHVSVVTNTAAAAQASVAVDNSHLLGGKRLKIKSPFPSPTGTISAANSCPTSPRHNSFHDYTYAPPPSHHHAHQGHHNNNHQHQHYMSGASSTTSTNTNRAQSTATTVSFQDVSCYKTVGGKFIV